MAQQAPIIVIKKKTAGHGHHGGAWKVAYADFVTAMMALFIVLWLMNTSEEARKMVGGYFQDPRGNGRMTGTKLAGNGEGIPLKKDDMPKLKQKLEAAMKKMQDFKKFNNNVQITITPEGLRVELMESQRGMFFENGSPATKKEGAELIQAMAQELGQIPNNVLIEGYTDAAPYSKAGAYTNWELSTDRANAARRLMERSGLRPQQISYVRGFADRRLKFPERPRDPGNRRISLMIQYQDLPPGTDPAKAH